MAKDGEKGGGWGEFVWNPRTREFMGRTASSWGKSTTLHYHGNDTHFTINLLLLLGYTVQQKLPVNMLYLYGSTTTTIYGYPYDTI